VGICKQITIFILYQVCSWLVTLLKFIHSSIQISNILVLAVCCKLTDFIFQTYSEMSASIE
jgi:hypothetical protein